MTATSYLHDKKMGRDKRGTTIMARPVAEVFPTAVELFGDRDQAEAWFRSRVMGLDGQRPIDLMRTTPGAQLVKDFLIRLEHGVYT